jgi:hypothetical protein
VNQLNWNEVNAVTRQVTHLLGKPLLRVFPELRGIHQLESGWGLNIVPPPDHDTPEAYEGACRGSNAVRANHRMQIGPTTGCKVLYRAIPRWE